MLKNFFYFTVYICIFILSAKAEALNKGAYSSNAQKTQSHLPTPRPVQSRSEYKPHVGAVLGMASLEGSYYPANDYGLDIGFQPYIPYGLGVQLDHAHADGKKTTPDITRTTAILRASYNFGGDNEFLKRSYVGMGLGTSFGDGGNLIVSAAMLGFDIPLEDYYIFGDDSVSLGAAAKYTVYEGSNPDALTINGTVKYWF